MSFLGLFGKKPAVPANTVVIPDDLAAALTAGGHPLGEAVESALRVQLAAAEQLKADDPGAMPFWLRREEPQDGDAVEDELLQKVQSRTNEASS
jgi:hypothetical protein